MFENLCSVVVVFIFLRLTFQIRLEDKFSNLEAEIQVLRQGGVSITATPAPTPEIQVLRQQAVTPTTSPIPTPNKFGSGLSRSIIQVYLVIDTVTKNFLKYSMNML